MRPKIGFVVDRVLDCVETRRVQTLDGVSPICGYCGKRGAIFDVIVAWRSADSTWAPASLVFCGCAACAEREIDGIKLGWPDAQVRHASSS